MTEEEVRLKRDRDRVEYWKRWGPYLSERQWGTVREDYSPNGEAWDYFPHDIARSRAYRWGEDGIAGISDNHQRLCFSLSLWNGADAILKERLFGLTGSQGNHGEDVKEYYFYLDNTPTHSYMKYLYKYPHVAFPYDDLVAENRRRDRQNQEYELLDTGIFAENRYFDVAIEYAKRSPEDILIQISASNRGSEAKVLHLLPTLWFRNTWSWGKNVEKPSLKALQDGAEWRCIEAKEQNLGSRWLYCAKNPELLFVENETNLQRLFGVPNPSPYVKDGINNYVVNGQKEAVNPVGIGTKVAARYQVLIPPGQTQIIQLRLSNKADLTEPFGREFEQIFASRIQEANDFYDRFCSPELSPDKRNIQRQAFAGMLWNKQFYHYVVTEWLEGAPGQSPPPAQRQEGRNSRWQHFYSDDVLSMPDKWEYPWFAAWDLAFHTLPFAAIDPDYAKHQLHRLTREWYMHPNGQLPAYEWSFDDVNPPVHAWAAMQVYQIERQLYGRSDIKFLERVFQKLLLNFTWWVNRQDLKGKNVFEGGFLGLDNISIFDRSKPFPGGSYIQQSDGTAWMAMYSLNMLEIALELTQYNPVYEDIASKFFEHFIYIADAMNSLGCASTELWDDIDGFYYDVLNIPGREPIRLKVHSLVGIVALFAIATISHETLHRLPEFKRRATWFLENRPGLAMNIAYLEATGTEGISILSLLPLDRLRRILQRLLDENEFLSPWGIRSLSRYHTEHPFSLSFDGQDYCLDYEPAESTTGLFGGNSNWRGPIWFPINYLIIEALQKFDSYLGDDFKVECPTGSGQMMTLKQVAVELGNRLRRIFQQDSAGKRPVYGRTAQLQSDRYWRDLILFYEYFHGDNGAGLGASHQTGWTGLVAMLMPPLSDRNFFTEN
ncbi:glucosidase [Oscillatoria sp. FACHB-1406]|nr:glucosidase [Oscillatoria sp. FACHB-1406]MBD2576724.1 glucosidase [Oscillatoria sp. FACHB-1406]